MTEDTIIIGFIILMVGIIVLCYMAKVAQEARDAKEEKNKPAESAVVQPTAASAPQAVVAQADDDAELVAVISAAIAAISGSATVQVLSIRSGSKAWVLAGRQELMNEF